MHSLSIFSVQALAVDGISVMTGYVYDAEGQRVAKGSIMIWSCDASTNGFEASANETDYVLDQNGHQITEMTSDGSSINWAHTNVWVDGQLIANYSASTDNNGNPSGTLQFLLNDWLGTRRAMTDYAGLRQQTCASLPFGDGETCASTPTEHLFTGKERDQESGNDYFGARYYASTMGRFLSPDWSAKEEPVPYASLDNPQTLNLYQYMRNNPLGGVDPDGHDPGTAVLTWSDVLEATEAGEAAGPEGGLILGGLALFGFAATHGGGPAYTSYYHGEFQNPDGTTIFMKSGQNSSAPQSPSPTGQSTPAQPPEGGGRNAQKSNPDKVSSAKDKLSSLREQRDQLKAKANKTPEDKAALDKVNKAINRETDRMRKSESHSQKQKGQQQ